MNTTLDILVTEHRAMLLRARDFHNGDTVFDDWYYNSKAEDEVNRMTNVELLSALGEALRWYRDGGDIGL